jgi:hypothetical protein
MVSGLNGERTMPSVKAISRVTVVFSLVVTVHALSVDIPTWPELIEYSELAGIVECTVAGSVVAKYRMVEVWKGEGPKGEFYLVEPPFPATAIPIALVGERFIVLPTNSKQGQWVDSYLVGTKGTPQPLLWRRLPVEYSVSSLFGRYSLQNEPEREDYFAGLFAPILEIRECVKTFVSKPDEERQLDILRARLEKYLNLRSGTPTSVAPGAQDVYAMLRSATSLEDILSKTMSVAVDSPPRLRDEVGQAVLGYAHPKTLSILEKLETAPAPFEESVVDAWLRSVRDALRPAGTTAPLVFPQRYTFTGGADAACTVLSEALNTGRPMSEFPKFWYALGYLSVEDPKTVVKWLSTWENPEEDQQIRQLGYELGSTFAHYCEVDREKYFKRLLKAKDPCVQVSAAVYMAFENEEAGLRALRKFAELPGDPGTWAALALARRGETDVVPRLLEVFQHRQRMGSFTKLLRDQTRILLSNSASASNIRQPALPLLLGSAEQNFDYYNFYMNWWKDNQPHLQLHDPWFEMLAEQKID